MPCVSWKTVTPVHPVQALAVFGGKTLGQTHFGDLFVFDLLAEAWCRVRLSGDALPVPRACHSVREAHQMVAHHSRLIVIGGTNEAGFCEDPMVGFHLKKSADPTASVGALDSEARAGFVAVRL